jgi:hypothetical protein
LGCVCLHDYKAGVQWRRPWFRLHWRDITFAFVFICAKWNIFKHFYI